MGTSIDAVADMPFAKIRALPPETIAAMLADATTSARQISMLVGILTDELARRDGLTCRGVERGL